MFLDRNSLHSSLLGVVGFHNPTNPEYPNLLPSLLGSTSGLYVNDCHSLLTIENLVQSIKNFSHYNYTAFSTVTRDAGGYTTGSKTAYSGTNYEYIDTVASSVSTPLPDADADVWREIDELSDYLIKAVYSGIDRMLDSFMNGKKMKTVSKSIFENILLYQGTGDLADTETNNDKFVGIRLRFKKKQRNIVGIINKIGCHFNSSFEGLDIKLYHDSQQDHISTFAVNHSTANSFQWNALTTDNILRFFDSYDAGGDFYLGYKQSDLDELGARAINKNVSWETRPITDDDVWLNYFKQYSKYIDIIGFSVDESRMVNDKMFNPVYMDLTPLKTYGLNLNLTVKADLTPLFTQENHTLSNAIKYNVGMVLMESLAYNTRESNQIANQVRAQAEKQLFHHKEAYGTLYDKCKGADQGLSFDFSEMDDVLAADNKHRFRINSGSV